MPSACCNGRNHRKRSFAHGGVAAASLSEEIARARYAEVSGIDSNFVGRASLRILNLSSA